MTVAAAGSDAAFGGAQNAGDDEGPAAAGAGVGGDNAVGSCETADGGCWLLVDKINVPPLPIGMDTGAEEPLEEGGNPPEPDEW